MTSDARSLPGADGGRPAPSASAWLRMLLWIWVAAALAAYLWQFRPLVRPILEALGIS